jgi:VIT1/CCC1 family predicted Fe2+/Mn2+ transporter
VNAWEAAGASALSFLLGGLLSLLAILLPPAGQRVGVCVAVVLASLAGTGYLAARFGSAPTGRAALRNLAVGGLTMAVTYGLGALAQTLL